MYFSLKYIDWATYQKTKDAEVEETDIKKKVVTTKNKELLVNPDCFLAIIMDYIFEQVGVKESERVNFDVMTEKGKLLNVHTYPPNYSGIHIFNDKVTHFLALRDGVGEAKPIISTKSKEYWTLLENRKKSAILRKTKSLMTRASRSSFYNPSICGVSTPRSIKAPRESPETIKNTFI